MRFESFTGNRKIVDRLQQKLREERFPHGLIFSGPDGVGKRTLAIMIAKALNCTNAQPGEFCGECQSCRKIESGTHPDVMMITVEEDASQIKIAQIRRLLGLLDLQPLEGRNKVFIIDPANSLNDESANALLKGLEEPPEKSYFILISVNAQELLITVRSRCQIYNFTPLRLDEIRSQGIADDLTARWSQGSIGRARTLDIAELKSERDAVMQFFEIVIKAKEDQFSELLRVSGDLGRAKQDFQDRLSILGVLIADVLYIQESAPERVINVDIRDRLGKLAVAAPAERLIEMAEFLRFIESSLKGNANRQMLADVLALTGNDAAFRTL